MLQAVSHAAQISAKELQAKCKKKMNILQVFLAQFVFLIVAPETGKIAADQNGRKVEVSFCKGLNVNCVSFSKD